MFKTAEMPIQCASIEPVLDLTRTPLPVQVIGTVQSEVNIFRAEPNADSTEDPFPKPGDEFYGFELVEELGRGAFGRVFLARERKLADRPVVLKIALKANNEQLRLARLQHTNIVPIQDAYRKGPYYIIQMPYFGKQTLADVIEYIRTETGFPKVGGEVFTTVAKVSTHRDTKANSSKSDSGVLSHDPPSRSEYELHEGAFETQVNSSLRNLFSGMPYSEAVLLIIRRMAEGLAHAHNRGILHLDLKPQNVLLNDDGQPMLLDFNLSQDRTRRDRRRVGGTWPYMAPEIIRDFAKISHDEPTEQTDLYALGILYFELLTCQLPFSPIRRVPEDLANALAERERGIPSIRDYNPEVPSAVEAIIRKLTDPEPRNRYHSADELREDLQRQFENRPLSHAPDRDLFERFQKWQKRNPLFISRATGAVAIIGLTVGSFMLWDVLRQRAIERTHHEVGMFLSDYEIARSQLTVPTDIKSRQLGIETATRWMDHFGAGQTANWTQSKKIQSLQPERRDLLLSSLGESALLLAHAEMMESRAQSDTERQTHLERAMKWNRLAEECYGSEPVSTLLTQRRVLLNLKGETKDAEVTDLDLKKSTNTDLYLQAAQDIGEGRMASAIKLLKKLTDVQPNHYAAQLMLGLTYQATGQPHRALERLQVAKPLAKDDPRPGYHIGLLHYYIGKFEDAESAFASVLSTHPDHAPTLMQRGITLMRERKYTEAIADFTKALEAGGPSIPLYYYRSQAHRHAGRNEEAQADLEIAKNLEPTTAEDYSVRAAQLHEKNPSESIKLYSKALQLNPYFLSAWHNKAYVLSEKLSEWDLALEAMKSAVAIAPSFAPSRGGLAILYARLHRRELAIQEIEKALAISGDAELYYQAACVYALTSAKVPADRAKALDYFRKCFREGYSHFANVHADPDLKAVLERDEFKTVLDAAEKLIK